MRLVVFFLAASSLYIPAIFAETPAKPKAAESAAMAALGSKVDNISKDQKEILRQLAEIKQELLIVKARATR